MKKSLFLFCFVLLGFLAFSQNMSVSSFRCIENDLTARVANVEDINNKLCALIIVNTPVRGLEFGGCSIEKTEQKTGAMWVFVSPGVKFITIMHRDLGQLRSYPFPEPIKSGYVYEMVLQTAKITQTIEESITDQYLIIESSTPEAKIFINNEFAGRNSAVKLLSIFEEHSYRVEAPLYHTKSGSVKLTSEQKAILNIDLDTAFGYLKVNTSPVGGAEIEINGKLQEGKTPFFSQKLESGNYKVQAFMPLYKSELQEVDIYDGKTSEITINLIPTFANVEITCQDKDAEIYIDGKYKAKGGFKGQLNEGAYQLEVKKQSHRAIKKIINAISGQNLIENIDKLQAINGKLNLNSTPYGAKIFIDHKPYGETPIVIPEILVGKHELRLEKNGYHTLYEQINIEEGKIAKYDLVLKEKPTSQLVLEPKKERIKLPIAKHDISLHGGIGLISSFFDTPAFSIGMKYKYKPSDKYDIRLLGEIGTAFAPSTNLIDFGLSIIPIMAGVNYEYRFTKSISIWTDFAFGISIPLSDERAILYLDFGSDGYIDEICDRVSSFKTGFASSAEIGMNYNDFSFSFKGVFSVNESFAPFFGDNEYTYNSLYLLFQVGYHF